MAKEHPMGRHGRIAVLALSWLLIASVPSEKDGWIEVRTPNFILYSAAREGATREIAGGLERLRAVLGRLTSWELSTTVPVQVYVFRGDKDFEPYKPLYDGKPADLSGFFLARDDGNFIAVDGSSREDPAKRLYHEYVHFLVNNNFPDAPLWLNEGLAEVYSSFEVSGEHAVIGGSVARHIDELAKTEWIPLARLLAIGVDSPEYNEDARRDVFYAQSWALVHFLATEREDELARFLRSAPVDFGTGEGLEKELREYVRRKVPVLRAAAGKSDEVTLAVRPMAYPEVLVRLGSLLAAQEDRLEAAAGHFRAAAERRPSDPGALAGLADVVHRQGRRDEALDLYRQAYAAGGHGFLLDYRYAKCLLDAGDSGDLAQALSALRRSVELQPHFAPARSLLEAAQSKQSAIDARRAEAIAHNRFAERYNEVVRVLNEGDLRRAKTLTEELVAASVGAQAEEARTLLEQIRRQEELEASVERVNRLLAQRRTEEAVEILRQIQAVPGSKEERWIAEKIAEIERAHARGRFAERFNEALGHLERGDARTACRLLEELLATLPEDSAEAQRTRQLLEKARAELKRRGG